MATNNRLYGYIILNNDAFDGLRRPRHILAEYLADAGYKVFFQSSAVEKFSQRHHKKFLKFGGLKSIQENLLWYQPPSILPNVYREKIGPLIRWIRVRLSLTLHNYCINGKKIYIVTVPNCDYVDLLRIDKDSLVIYYIHDSYTNADGVWPPEHFQLCSRADALLVTSNFLRKEMTGFFPKKPIFLFLPGIDFKVFQSMDNGHPRAKSDVTLIKIGCVGNLGTQVDWDLLLALSLYPDIELILVGPVNADILNTETYIKISQRSNIKIVGKISHEMVSDYVKTFDICIVPFVKNNFTDSVNPLKLLEYLAHGKIVISTSIPYTKDYSEIIEVADTPEEWYKAIIKSINSNSLERIQARKRFVSQSGYDVRVKKLVEITDNIISNRLTQ